MTQLDFHDLLMPKTNAPINLQEAFDLYDDAASEHPGRSSIRSSFKLVSRALRLPLDQISADPVRLREQLKNGGPAYAGVKPSAWKAGKSRAVTALRYLNVEIAPSRDDTVICPSWQAWCDQAPSRKLQIGISKFLRFLTRTGVEPAALNLAHFEAWRDELEQKSIKAGVATSYRQLLRHWKACGNAVRDWPLADITTSSDPRRYSLDWENFPPAFRADVEAYLMSRIKPDPFSDNPAKPIRADTASGRRNLLRAIASALVLSKAVPASEIVSLSVLTEIENVRSALRYLRDERHGGKIGPQDLGMADLLRTLAKYVEKDEIKTDAIRALMTTLSAHLGDQNGITAKNRERLSQFEDPGNIKRLVNLPGRTLRDARQADPTHLNATRVMYALQVGILLVVPMRLKNLTELKYGENLQEVGTGKSRRYRIFLPRAQTKTYMD